MTIEIKYSKNPVEYVDAVNFLEQRILDIRKNTANELIWFLQHKEIYTGGTSFKPNEILDNSIDVYKTNRGGKITWHGPGQNICYFVIDLNKRKKDIRKLITAVENTIIDALYSYNIKSFNDRNNVGIWIKHNNKIKKVGAIGIRVSKWIAYHGFSININNDLKKYEKIIPCGIKNKEVINLKTIKNQNYDDLNEKIKKNFIQNLKTLVF